MIPKLPEAGYTNIVLAGQSSGGYLSVDGLRLDKIRNLITGVIDSAGVWDSGTDAPALLQVPDDWHRLIGGLEPTSARVVMLYFNYDTYNWLADHVVHDARETLTQKQIPNLAIYNDDPEIQSQAEDRNGHFGAYTPKFTLEYADCLVHFIDTGEKTGICAKY